MLRSRGILSEPLSHIYRKAESHDSHAIATFHAVNKRFLEKAGEYESGSCNTFRALQFLQDSPIAESDTCYGCGNH